MGIKGFASNSIKAKVIFKPVCFSLVQISELVFTFVAFNLGLILRPCDYACSVN